MSYLFQLKLHGLRTLSIFLNKNIIEIFKAPGAQL